MPRCARVPARTPLVAFGRLGDTLDGIATPATRHVFGLDFIDAGSTLDIVDAVESAESNERERWSCTVTPNVDHVVRYAHDPLARQVAEHATLVLPDGMPIVWGSRLVGRPLEQRLTGADLFAALWPRLAAERIPTVVVASSDDVADRLRAEHPACDTIVPPLFDVDDEAAVTALVDQIVETVDASDARYLFIGVSMPKHHLLASRLRERWDRQHSPHVLLLGASADFYLGLAQRAPKWMQDTGLEWLHRFVSEPRRMARRYFVDDPYFLRLLWREWRAARRSPRSVHANG